MSEQPTYGEPSGQEPTYAADADGSITPADGGQEESGQDNSDVHAAARKAAEDAGGEGANTPGA